MKNRRESISIKVNVKDAYACELIVGKVNKDQEEWIMSESSDFYRDKETLEELGVKDWILLGNLRYGIGFKLDKDSKITELTNQKNEIKLVPKVWKKKFPLPQKLCRKKTKLIPKEGDRILNALMWDNKYATVYVGFILEKGETFDPKNLYFIKATLPKELWRHKFKIENFIFGVGYKRGKEIREEDIYYFTNWKEDSIDGYPPTVFGFEQK